MAGKHQLQIALKSIKKENWSNKIVLDIGCSNGSLTSEILDKTNASKIIGIDFDNERIKKTQKLNNKKLKFILLDANNMKIFSDNYFDVVFSNMAFQQFNNFRIPLKEVFRVLKPKGKAIINFNQEKKVIFFEIDQIKLRLFGLTKKTRQEKKISAEKFKEEASKIGFSKISVQTKDDICFFETFGELIGGSADFGLDESKNKLIFEELKRVLEKQKTKNGYPENLNIVFCKLVK